MGRLEEKLSRVAGVGLWVTNHLEKRADDILAREPKVMALADSLFDAKVSILDDANKALDGVEASLKLLSNDPLLQSGGSQGSQAETQTITDQEVGDVAKVATFQR